MGISIIFYINMDRRFGNHKLKDQIYNSYSSLNSTETYSKPNPNFSVVIRVRPALKRERDL